MTEKYFNLMCSLAHKTHGVGEKNGAFKDGFQTCYEHMLDTLEEINEFTASHLETMEHLFENKYAPTSEEVNQVAIADSHIRLLIGRI